MIFINDISREFENKHENTFIQVFCSVPGCQTCMCHGVSAKAIQLLYLRSCWRGENRLQYYVRL